MLLSYAVRSVYVESSSMFVRGGVYRVVKEALGGTLAKLSVSALMFDYILTGPISGVSAGQYVAGLINELMASAYSHHFLISKIVVPENWISVAFALAVTLYYWWQNTKGIEESSDKALRVMQITTVMVIILIGWSLLSVAVKGAKLPPFPLPENLRFSLGSLGFLTGTWLVPPVPPTAASIAEGAQHF